MAPRVPSVHERLATVERLIARDERSHAGQDALALVEARPEDVLVQEGEENDLRQALSRAEIRRVFYRLLHMGGLFDSDSDPQPVVMAHHAGRRSLAVDLYKAIKKVDSGAYAQMEREHESNLKSRENKKEEAQ